MSGSAASSASASSPSGFTPGPLASECAISTCRHFTRSGMPPPENVVPSDSIASRSARYDSCARRYAAASSRVLAQPLGHLPHQPRGLQPARRRRQRRMRQVVQRRKRCSVRQSRSRLDDTRAHRSGIGRRSRARRGARGQAGARPHRDPPAQPPGGVALPGTIGGTGAAGTGGTVVGDIVRGVGDGVPQRGVPRLARPRGLDFLSPAAGSTAPRTAELHLERDVARLDEAEPLAGLRRNVGRVSQFRLPLLQLGDLGAQPASLAAS